MGKAERVLTGHAGGKITINLREADTVERERWIDIATELLPFGGSVTAVSVDGT